MKCIFSVNNLFPRLIHKMINLSLKNICNQISKYAAQQIYSQIYSHNKMAHSHTLTMAKQGYCDLLAVFIGKKNL